MENNALLNQEFRADQILKVTALLYLKEALVGQQYEVAPSLIEAAKNAGANQGEISLVIADYLRNDAPSRQKPNRLRKEAQ
jgi:hypothetical protein